MRALDRKLVRDLGLLKGQVLTIALVVAAGVASFVALQSTYASLFRSRERYYEQQRFADVFVRLERAPMSLLPRIEALPGVATAYGRVVEDIHLPLPTAEQPPVGQVVSVPADAPAPLNAVYLQRGRMPRAGAREEGVLLSKFAESRAIAIGDTVPVVMRGTRHELRIVGIAMAPEFIYPMEMSGQTAPDEKRFAAIWMERGALARMLEMEGAFNDLALRLQPGASETAVLHAVDRLLQPYGGLGAVGRAQQPSNYVLSGELEQLRGLATVVPAIFLGVAAFLLNVVLSRLVLLQRGQIATLKAVGYPDRQIGLHYQKLVTVVVLIGTALGTGLGAWFGTALTGLYADVFGIPQFEYRLGGSVVLQAVAASLGAGVLGALVAAVRVMNLPPAQAMQPPAPPTYRPTILERLGANRLLGSTGRMILREVERKPLRTMLSSLGIAMAVGILIAGRFNVDAVDYLIELQFENATREDLLVSFVRPLPRRAIGELRNLPGVLEAEGQRVVPVRFRVGHRWRQGLLTGHTAGAQLRRPLDQHGVPARLPARGMVITTMLGRLLGAGPGDTVTVEVQEGRRAWMQVPVVAVVDELIGLQGHMRLEALLEALGEEQGFSTGLLRVDATSEDDIERRLADMPNVASVTSRRSALRHFSDQMEKTILVMTLVVTIFAATIAIGVVYNNARIALSVRSRDLASLRVLGLRRREISAILLGELAVEVLLALPLGLVAGRWMAAGIASLVDPERIRLPVVVSDYTDAFAVAVTLASALVSALLVRRQLDHLDLIGVLKTRE